MPRIIEPKITHYPITIVAAIDDESELPPEYSRWYLHVVCNDMQIRLETQRRLPLSFEDPYSAADALATALGDLISGNERRDR